MWGFRENTIIDLRILFTAYACLYMWDSNHNFDRFGTHPYRLLKSPDIREYS